MIVSLLLKKREADRKMMLEIFRLAIPEITDKAEIFVTNKKVFDFPDLEGVELKDYVVSKKPDHVFHFTIARALVGWPVPKEYVVLREMELEPNDATRYPIILEVKNTGSQKYKCPDCGWIGTEEEMRSDFQPTADDDMWSNWICPQCGTWHQLSDYIKVEQK